MTNDGQAHSGRAHLWTVDAVLGLSLALMAFTVAQAALPTPPAHTRPAAPAVIQALAQAAPVAPAPALIAFSAPLPGRTVGSPFGRRQLPWEENGRLHAGVDIAANAGQSILASADGVVVRVADDAGYGHFVEVKHAQGLTTLYGHMSRSLAGVVPGAAVKAGAPLGLVGSTGSSTGSHLHFEIRDAQERPMNPEMFLGRQFATSADLPLSAALKLPKGTRMAFVSNIPASKRAMMDARLNPTMAATRTRPLSQANINMIEASLSGSGVVVSQPGQRPHVRFNPVFPPEQPLAPRSDPTL